VCSDRVRGVDGSRAEHLTVESHTVVYAAISHTYYYEYSITPSLFHSRLKTLLHGFSRLVTVTSEHIRFFAF